MNRILIAVFYILVFTNIYAFNDQIIFIEEGLRLKPVAENVWIHKSDIYMEKWGRVSANGMAIISDGQLVLVDTPWNDRQTRLLVEWFKKNNSLDEVHLIVGHYHQDNLGGLNWINQNGMESYSIKRTEEICQMKGLAVPKRTIGDTYDFNFYETPIEVRFIGMGHTEDSICVYLPKQKILFGGCSVKSLNNQGLGNIIDANIEEWPNTLRKMKKLFSGAELVIPGHGLEGDLSLIDHTLSLFK